MKKITFLILSLFIFAFVSIAFSGCGEKSPPKQSDRYAITSYTYSIMVDGKWAENLEPVMANYEIEVGKSMIRFYRPVGKGEWEADYQFWIDTSNPWDTDSDGIRSRYYFVHNSCYDKVDIEIQTFVNDMCTFKVMLPDIEITYIGRILKT